MTSITGELSKSRILSLYRSLCRRLYFSPLEPKATQNLFRIQRHYFRKKINDSPLIIPQDEISENSTLDFIDSQFVDKTLEYRLKLGENHLNTLKNAFINGNEKSILFLLRLAFNHSHVNNKYIAKTWKYNVPSWLSEFKLGDGRDYVDCWPVRRIAILSTEHSPNNKQANLKLETIKEPFDAFYKTIDEFSANSKKLESNNYHNIISMHSKIPPEKPEKLSEEKQLRIESNTKKVSNLIKFLRDSEGKLHKKSVCDFAPVIPLHRMGYPLVFERQRNIVLKRIKEIKELLNSLKPFNYIYYLYIRNFIENNHFKSQKFSKIFETQKSRNRQRDKELKDGVVSNKKYKDETLYITSYQFNDPDNIFLRGKYLQMINKEYSITEDDKIVYLDTLQDFESVKMSDECLEMSEMQNQSLDS